MGHQSLFVGPDKRVPPENGPPKARMEAGERSLHCMDWEIGFHPGRSAPFHQGQRQNR